MHAELGGIIGSIALIDTLLNWLGTSYAVLKVIIGFSIIIFVHELGHFLAAKAMNVRVDRFSIGFLYRLCGYRRGEGFTFGPRPEYKPAELAAKGYGETDYCLKALPFGGYVKMLGEDDVQINDETGEIKNSDDPRAFTNKSVGRRLVVVSAGVIFNLLFAILIYSMIFGTVGRRVLSPVIGRIDINSLPAKAGLWPGDRVLAIDGTPVESFDRIMLTRMLAAAPLRFTVERGGQVLSQPIIVPALIENDGGPPRDMAPELTTEFSMHLDPNTADGLRPHDKVTRVNGATVQNAYQVMLAFQQSGGAPVTLTVERKEPNRPDELQTLNVTQRPQLELLPAEVRDPNNSRPMDSENLLGFRRRLAVHNVLAPPAQRAGFRVGDVIVQWDSVANPLFNDVIASIESHPGQPVPVVVERGGETLHLEVTPPPAGALSSAPPRVGLEFGGEDAPPIVADVAPDTPATALGMPRGAVLQSIGGRATTSWSEVLEALLAAAGKTVDVRYRAGEDVVTGRLDVPSSVVNELDLPPTVQIRAIDGAQDVVLESGAKLTLPSPAAVRMLLQKAVGRTVTVQYLDSIIATQSKSGSFAVRRDNTDPWQLRAAYGWNLVTEFRPLTQVISAHGNPLVALQMGFTRAGDDLRDVYRVVKTMLRGTVARTNVGVRNVSGPIGIVQQAVQHAELGFSDLLYFLAFISVNLAIVNLAPLPVVDGGLILFLLLEKLRGRRLSVKVQVITTLAGLAVIVLCFLFVTFQDITKLVSGSL